VLAVSGFLMSTVFALQLLDPLAAIIFETAASNIFIKGHVVKISVVMRLHALQFKVELR
jgi:hypothetical protein